MSPVEQLKFIKKKPRGTSKSIENHQQLTPAVARAASAAAMGLTTFQRELRVRRIVRLGADLGHFGKPIGSARGSEGGPQISRLRTEPPQNDAKSAQAGRSEKVKQFDVKVVSKCQALHGGSGAPVPYLLQNIHFRRVPVFHQHGHQNCTKIQSKSEPGDPRDTSF